MTEENRKILERINAYSESVLEIDPQKCLWEHNLKS